MGVYTVWAALGVFPWIVWSGAGEGRAAGKMMEEISIMVAYDAHVFSQLHDEDFLTSLVAISKPRSMVGVSLHTTLWLLFFEHYGERVRFLWSKEKHCCWLSVTGYSKVCRFSVVLLYYCMSIVCFKYYCSEVEKNFLISNTTFLCVLCDC